MHCDHQSGGQSSLPRTCYVSYASSISLALGEAIPVATNSENSFALDHDAFERAWQPGCKVLMLNFPTNPTGGGRLIVKSLNDWQNLQSIKT